MNYEIVFDPTVTRTLSKWKKSNPVSFKKLGKILLDIAEHPRQGIGHPEPLIGGGNTIYSRRITARDRIIYEIYDEKVVVLIIEIEGHYNDK